MKKHNRDAPLLAHLSSPIEHLTGSRGPLRLILDRLRTVGLGERVLKSALAVFLSWELAQLIPGNPNPVLAAMTGMFSINLTIAGSVRDAVQRVLGVIWGVGVALGVNALFGLHGWSLAIVVIVSFAGGQRLGLESSGLSQMAISALLVILGTIGTRADNAAWLHFVNTLVGTGIGIVLNAVVAPPNYLPAARNAVRTIGENIADIHEDLAHTFATGLSADPALRCLERARSIAASVDAVEDAIRNGEESLKYHLLSGGQWSTLHVYRRSTRALEFAAVQTRVMSRAIYEISISSEIGDCPAWADPDNLGREIGEVLSVVSVAIDHFLTLVDRPRPSLDDELVTSDVTRSCAALTLAAQSHIASMIPNGWTLLGEVIALSGQLVADLSIAANDVGEMLATSRTPETGARSRR